MVSDGTYTGILEAGDVGGPTVKAISQSTADLFKMLRIPRKVSEIFPEMVSPARDEIVANFVFDGVFEVCQNGKYVSGIASYDIIVQDDSCLNGEGRLSTLSHDAIEHCYRLAVPNAIDLAWKLYFYNRLPVTPRWCARWPNSQAVLQFLKRAAADVELKLAVEYQIAPSLPEEIGWLAWIANKRLGKEVIHSGRYKLYISPSPDDISAAFYETACLLPGSNARGFKIGINAHGLMRPDKFIVYFDQFHELQAFVSAIRMKLVSISSHGVPFTAALDDSGLLSWGVDPEKTGHLLWHSDDSWRIWICNRLANSMLDSARHQASSDLAMRYALARLWLSGVNTRVWIKRSLLAPVGQAQVFRGAL